MMTFEKFSVSRGGGLKDFQDSGGGLKKRGVVGFLGFRGEDLKRGEENYSGGGVETLVGAMISLLNLKVIFNKTWLFNISGHAIFMS